MSGNPKPHDIAGWRFGMLTAVKIAAVKPPRWLCRCDCGAESVAYAGNLRSGKTKSCGCNQNNGASGRTHGLSDSAPEYKTWAGIKRRCFNKNDKAYPAYGGSGITVCDRWSTSFEAFFSDMGPKPGPEYSIDRIDGTRGYEPGNCRWATDTQQARNRRDVKLSEEKVARIRDLHAGGRTIRSLAREFDVSQRSVQFAVRGVTWK